MKFTDIKSIAMNNDAKMNRARIFWKVTTVIFFLTTVAGVIAWKIESYAHQMDAKVIRLEVEKELRGTQSNATASTTTQSTIPTSHVVKASVTLGKN